MRALFFSNGSLRRSQENLPAVIFRWLASSVVLTAALFFVSEKHSTIVNVQMTMAVYNHHFVCFIILYMND